MPSLPQHVVTNRNYWDGMADDWVAPGEAAWNAEEPTWGCWGVLESQLQLLPETMTGLHAIELGCGTGYCSGWMARRGATVVGIDNSERQLATAQRLAKQHGVALTLLHGNAESVPYPDQSFDFALSEYGAVIWCDPFRWVPEAHRLLKPGGQLVCLGNSPLTAVCTPPNGEDLEPTLHRPYFGIHRLDWTEATEPGGFEFNLPISEWFRLFRDTGFEVLDFIELQAPPSSPDRYGTPGSWAERWPAEQAWKLRKR